MLTATQLNAQNDGSRGLFGMGPKSTESNRDGEGMGLGGATEENPTGAPLGNGIAVLVAVGAGYVLVKRKEDKQ